MARFMISMPDEMLKKIDEVARKEHRSRSELLREAARQHLAGEAGATTRPDPDQPRTEKKISSRGSLARQRMLRLGIGQKGCPGLDRLIGPNSNPPEMRRLLKIGKQLSGLSRNITESRKDRL